MFTVSTQIISNCHPGIITYLFYLSNQNELNVDCKNKRIKIAVTNPVTFFFFLLGTLFAACIAS